MPSVPFEYNRFVGLQHGIDRKRAREPYCADGRNFFVDIDGPVSGFGKQWLWHQELNESRGAQTLRNAAEDDAYVFTADAICVWDADTHQMIPVYRHATRSEWWPWTRAYVGTSLYLCNKEIGVIVYNTLTGQWSLLAGANVPANPIAVCESGGRLMVLAELVLAWSAIDDGSNAGLATSVDTGAGFQVLSSFLSAQPQPMMILPYSDGVLTYTQAGIMRSELRENSVNPFRHTTLSRTHRLLNPWAIALVGETMKDAGASPLFGSTGFDSHIFVTARGIFKTDGRDRPDIWDSLFSEYLHRVVLPNIDTHRRTQMTVRLDYDFVKGWLSVSLAEDSTNAVFTRTHIQYVPTKDWGVYNQAHTGFIEPYIGGAYNYGIVKVDGTAYWFGFYDSDRDFPVESLTRSRFTLPAEIPAQFGGIGATSIFSSMMIVTDEIHEGMIAPGMYDTDYQLAERFSPAAMEETDADETPTEAATYIFRAGMATQAALRRIAVAPIPYEVSPLNAELLIGPFRFPAEEERSLDMLTELQEAVIGMLDTGIADTYEDYIEDYLDRTVEVDWDLLDEEEDWGESVGDLTEYSVQFEGTIDGYAIWTINDFAQLTIPALISQLGRTRHLAGTVVGHYAFIRITAYNLGESFHLKHLRTSFTTAGHLH